MAKSTVPGNGEQSGKISGQRPIFLSSMANEADDIGIVRGLAWTSVGGDTLQIEVNVMPGKGEFCPDRPDWAM